MRSLLLRLEGPLQSWGTESRFPHRDTQREPSKSGVVGLLGAALGMPRDDDERLGQIATGRMAVRVDREGDVLADYHTAGGGTFRGKPHGVHGTSNPVITHRDYLTSASFLVSFTYDDDALVDQLDAALASPRWPISLGRRSCSPSVPVRAGVVDLDAEQALARAIFPSTAPPAAPLRVVAECAPSHPAAEPRQDQPVSFRLHQRSFARRWVRTSWIAAADVAILPAGTRPTSLVHLLQGS